LKTWYQAFAWTPAAFIETMSDQSDGFVRLASAPEASWPSMKTSICPAAKLAGLRTVTGEAASSL
jgi:hypothetical protein